MMKKFLILSLTFISAISYSQTIEIQGEVRDPDGDVVPGVKVFFIHQKDDFTHTDSEGIFRLKCETGEYDSLKFEKYGMAEHYVYVDERIQRKARKDGGIWLDVILPYKTFNPIDVRPTTPDTLFGTQEYSVEDFEFHKSGKMILLTYEKNLRNGSVLRLLDQKNKVIDKYYLDVDDPSVELKTDFRGNVHLITEKNVYYIDVQSERLSVYYEIREDYFRFIDPIIDTLADCIYFSNYSELYPAFDYFEFNVPDSTYRVLLTVEDGETMEFYRAEFKYLDNRTKLDLHRKEAATGVDKEIWAGAMFYTQTVYYDPLYAPLFRVSEDSLLIFDHYKDKMYRYCADRGFVDSIDIHYHKQARKSGWEQPLIRDKVTGKIYAMFLLNGYTYLSEIDQNTGVIKDSFKLYYKYIDRIQIVDNKVYYVYRPYESVQKKYIYMEDLE